MFTPKHVFDDGHTDAVNLAGHELSNPRWRFMGPSGKNGAATRHTHSGHAGFATSHRHRLRGGVFNESPSVQLAYKPLTSYAPKGAWAKVARLPVRPCLHACKRERERERERERLTDTAADTGIDSNRDRDSDTERNEDMAIATAIAMLQAEIEIGIDIERKGQR